MSSCKNSPITCPKCRHQQDFTIWNSVNVDLDSSLKERILSGELTRFTCDQCQHSCEVNYPLLYHDMTRRLMVYFVVGDDTSELSSLPFGAMMKGYQLRTVTSRNELVEKIWIAEAGLDDRAMELFKLSLIAQMEAAGNDGLFFAGEDRTPEGRHVANFAWLTQGSIESITTLMESYTGFAEDIAAILEKEPAIAGEWLRIDRDFAETLLAKYAAMGGG